jgi:hypothetical protein
MTHVAHLEQIYAPSAAGSDFSLETYMAVRQVMESLEASNATGRPNKEEMPEHLHA